MRPLRNAYAAMLLLLATISWASPWFLPRFLAPTTLGVLPVVAAIAGASSAFTPARKTLAHVSTFVHELAHCVAAVAVGASPRRITYQPDATGLAILEFPERVGRLRRSLVLLAGYLGPGIGAGVVLAGVLAGRPRETVVVLAVTAVGALVLLVRNLWGAGVTALLALIASASARALPDVGVEILLAFLSGMLTALGVRDTWEQFRFREPGDCDAGAVARELPVLPWRWIAGAQLLAALALTGLGGALIFRAI